MTNTAFTVSGGSGGGTVVSVAAVSANTNALTVTGSPVVQSGTLTFTSFGNLTSLTILTSGSAATYTVPANIHKILVECVGGGGGGGGCTGGGGAVSAGGGGGGGGYCRKLISTTPGTNFIYTVGTGGAGGAVGFNSGTAGINTTFDTMIASAGTGGGGSVTSSASVVFTIGNASSGGNAVGGDINVPGDGGLSAYNYQSATASNGSGGSGFYGRGGANLTLNTTGSFSGAPGAGYGGGGAGALQFNSGGNVGGGGSNGIIVITEFS